MIRVFAAVLFCGAVALAQPLPDPFVVLDIRPGIRLEAPHLGMRDTTVADVFWVRHSAADSEQFLDHAVVSLSSRQLISGPEVIRHTNNGSQRIGDVISHGAEGWTLLSTEADPFVDEWSRNRTLVMRGRDVPVQSLVVDTGRTKEHGVPPFDCHVAHYNTDLALHDRVGGGWVLSWIRNGCEDFGGWTEPLRTIQLAWLSSDFDMEGRSSCCEEDYLYGPERVLCVSSDHDSVVTLSAHWTNGDPESWPPFLRWQSLAGEVATIFQPHYPTIYWDMRRTHSGRVLAVSVPRMIDYHPLLVELLRDGEPTVLDTLPRSYGDVAFHPAFGFAIVYVDHAATILLARIDTAGVDVQPLGVFYVCDASHAIAQTDVTIARDGRVVVLWAERAEPSPETTLLKAAWVGWSTYLGSEDRHFIPHPSSFILSVFPNPFNSELHIEYSLPRAQHVEVATYNVLGQNVATLFDGMKSAGEHHTSWSPSGAAGLYFVTLRTAAHTRTSKVLYLK